MTPNDFLVTLDANWKNPQVFVMSQDGRDVRSFPYHAMLSNLPHSKCRFLAIHKDKLVVSDLGMYWYTCNDKSSHVGRLRLALSTWTFDPLNTFSFPFLMSNMSQMAIKRTHFHLLSIVIIYVYFNYWESIEINSFETLSNTTGFP